MTFWKHFLYYLSSTRFCTVVHLLSTASWKKYRQTCMHNSSTSCDLFYVLANVLSRSYHSPFDKHWSNHVWLQGCMNSLYRLITGKIRRHSVVTQCSSWLHTIYWTHIFAWISEYKSSILRNKVSVFAIWTLGTGQLKPHYKISLDRLQHLASYLFPYIQKVYLLCQDTAVQSKEGTFPHSEELLMYLFVSVFLVFCV